MIARRDNREKEAVGFDNLAVRVRELLEQMQKDLLQRALDFRAANTKQIDTYDELSKTMKEDPGFVWAHWCGSPDCEAKVSDELKTTIRLVPFAEGEDISTDDAPPPEDGVCVCCNQKSTQRVLWAKSY